MEKERVAVVGAGIGGLATAIRLVAKGYDVEVYEKSERGGGKIGEIREGSYRFDTGPSLFTLPQLLEELFDAAGTPQGNRLPYNSLSDVCQYFFSDGRSIKVPAEPGSFASLAEQQLDEPASGVAGYLTRAGKLYELTSAVFLFSPFQKLRSLFRKENLPVGLRLHKLKAHTTLHRHNRRSFKQKNTIQLFDRYATYNGSSPYKAPATLMMIAHLEHNLGAWFPGGGMRSIIRVLVQEAERLGVRFHYNTEVHEIIISNRLAIGVRTEEAKHYFDHVVSNADIFHTYKSLLPDCKLPRFLRGKELSTSAVIFYWGVNQTHPEMGLHNILFSEDYRMEFRHLYGKGSEYHDPTIYIYISSKENPSDAPEGGENWFVMVNAVPDYGQYNQTSIETIREIILQKIKKRLGADLQNHIVSENINTPMTLSENTNAHHGALYGTASNSMWSAFLRHPNFSRRIKNLWFTGGTVHPGGGIPLCLASASIVVDLISAQSKKH